MIRRASAFITTSELYSEKGAGKKEKEQVKKAIKETLAKFGPKGTLKDRVKY